ncbi:hypothetical protein Tco_0743268, partial [Tanacetum coccineum]
MSIYDFMTLPSWSDAKIVEESHHLSLPLLERVPSHTTAPATKDVIIPLPTPDEVAASLPDSRLAKKSKSPSLAKGVNEVDLANLCAELKDSLERDEGVSTRAVSALIPRLGKRLGAPYFAAIVSASKPSHAGASVPASTSGHNLSLGGTIASGHFGKFGAEILNDDFDTATHGKVIYLTLFPLAPGPYYMPYLYEGVSSPLYTKEEWDGPHAPECNILCIDIFKDPDVCRRALDQTITPAKLRRTGYLLPLELSNHVNILSALLVSHGYELNSRYTNLVSSRAHLQEMLDKKKGDVKLLHSEVTSLDSKLENLQRGYDALGQENREVRSQRDAASEEVRKLWPQLIDAKTTSASLSEELTQTDAKLSEQALTMRDLHNELVLEKSKSQGYKDTMDGLREEVTQFVGSSVESLIQKLLSSDEFHAALTHVASLSINYCVERGLRMGPDFDKALDDFPTTPFPFLSKIVTAFEGSLSDVAQILPDKFVRSATLVATTPSSANIAPEQVPP